MDPQENSFALLAGEEGKDISEFIHHVTFEALAWSETKQQLMVVKEQQTDWIPEILTLYDEKVLKSILKDGKRGIVKTKKKVRFEEDKLKKKDDSHNLDMEEEVHESMNDDGKRGPVKIEQVRFEEDKLKKNDDGHSLDKEEKVRKSINNDIRGIVPILFAGSLLAMFVSVILSLKKKH